MDWYQRFTKSLFDAFERAGRARVLTVLRGMDPDTLRDFGYAPELVSRGVSAWPWRIEATDHTPSPSVEANLLEAETDLRAYSDTELADLGIGRDAIADVMPPGRPGVDNIAA